MSRASSVEEIRERLGEIQDAAPERALALLSAHAPTDIAYLLEIAEAARGVVKRAARIPGENDIVTEYNVRRMDMKRLREALEADNE